MNVTEIIVLILGILVFILSFLLPTGRKEKGQESNPFKEEEVKEIIDRQVADAKMQIRDIVDETITYSMEKTERSMERLSNEKIMAVNEYSNTVLEQINKNHKEVVFLYDMLNEKHENLKETVSVAAKTVTEVKQTVKEAEETSFVPMSRLLPEEKPVRKVTKKVKESEAVQAEVLPVEDVPEDTATIEPAAMDAAKMEPAAKDPVNERDTARKEKKKKAEKVDVSTIAAPGRGGRNSNEKILELHKDGKSNMAIAKELGLGIGEVKLVIDLFEGI